MYKNLTKNNKINMSCKDCEQKEYICTICGKKYKSERFFVAHMEKHKEEAESINEEIEETKDDRATVRDQEIKTFFDGLGARITANRYDIERMYGWYRELYPKSNVGFDWKCQSCVSHAYKRLKQHYDKIK